MSAWWVSAIAAFSAAAGFCSGVVYGRITGERDAYRLAAKMFLREDKDVA